MCCGVRTAYYMLQETFKGNTSNNNENVSIIKQTNHVIILKFL